MEKLKKYFIIIIIALVAIFVVMIISNLGLPGNVGSGITLDKYYLSGGSYIATTSPLYRAASAASSTLTMSVSNAKHIDLNIWAKSTTTVPVIQWSIWFSSDDGANKNWYPEDGYVATASNLVTHGVSPLIHTWTPSATSSVGEAWVKNFGIEPVASKYMKVNFWSDKALSLYVEGVSQSDTN